MLDSGATHSFVHPRVVEQTSAATSKGQKLTVTVANGSTSISDDVLEVGLVFTAQGDSSRQVTTQAVLYVLEGLQTDVILGRDFLRRYNPQTSWIDSRVAMPCLGKKDDVCKSNANCVGSTQSALHGSHVSQCSNGITCTNQVVVSAKQVANSIKVNIVSAHVSKFGSW